MKYRSRVEKRSTCLENILTKKLCTMMYDCRYHRLTEMEFNARVDVTVDGQTD